MKKRAVMTIILLLIGLLSIILLSTQKIDVTGNIISEIEYEVASIEDSFPTGPKEPFAEQITQKKPFTLPEPTGDLEEKKTLEENKDIFLESGMFWPTTKELAGICTVKEISWTETFLLRIITEGCNKQTIILSIYEQDLFTERLLAEQEITILAPKMELKLLSSDVYVQAYTALEGNALELQARTQTLQTQPLSLQKETLQTLPKNNGNNQLNSLIAEKWQKFELIYYSPRTHAETDTNPNPFTDYELQTTFTSPSSQTYTVPGFFDGNGIGQGTGDTWKVRFSFNEEGTWTYQTSFTLRGNPLTQNGHGDQGSILVEPVDNNNAQGIYAKGRLEYVGERYLQFQEYGDYYLKGGADSPENWFGYDGFDDTTHHGRGYLLHFRYHDQDWNLGDPNFIANTGQDAKGIIGAMNYLSEQEINSIYFLPMNIGGDGKDTWPYADAYPAINPSGSTTNDNLHFDISKLTQWETVLDHAQRKGLVTQMVLCESETANKLELDGATMGPEREAYYKELIARFGYMPGIIWNICEEYDGYFRDLDLGNNGEHHRMINRMAQLDPYNHPIAIHSHEYPTHNLWLTDQNYQNANLQVMSIQHDGGILGTGNDIEVIQNYLEQNPQYRKVVIGVDEPISITQGGTRTGYLTYDQYRKIIIWPTYLSGGNLEIFDRDRDQSMQDFRTHQTAWEHLSYARKFLETTPYWDMKPQDNLINNINDAQVLAKVGEVYAVYLPTGGAAQLQVPTGTYEYRFYNPQQGIWGQTIHQATAQNGVITLQHNPYGETAIRIDFVCQANNCPGPRIDNLNPQTIRNTQNNLITFTGRNFGTICSLEVDGILLDPNIVQCQSNTQIQFNVPQGVPAKDYDINIIQLGNTNNLERSQQVTLRITN